MNNASTRGITASAGTTYWTVQFFTPVVVIIFFLFFLSKEIYSPYNLLHSLIIFRSGFLPIVEYSPLQPKLPWCVPYLSYAVTVHFLISVKDYNQGVLLPRLS